MEKIFDIKVVKNVEVEFKKISKKLAPDPLNIDRLILNKLSNKDIKCKSIDINKDISAK